LSLLFVLIGLICIASGFVAIGAIIVFTFYSVNTSIIPAIVSERSTDRLHAVATNATWRDIGAAAGTLICGFILNTPYLTFVLLFCTTLLFFFLVVSTRSSLKPFRTIYLWK
jgi:predicted MFS family arabinose efflux permease